MKKAKHVFLEGVNRWFFIGLFIFAVTAIVNFCVPKAPSILYGILYGFGACLLAVYMALTLVNHRKQKP